MDGDERAIVGATMLGHAMVHTYELSIPVFVPIWLSEWGLTPAAVGTLVAVGYALFGVGALPSGVLADVVGSRRLILVCVGGMGAAFLVVAAAPGPAGLLVGLGLWGLAASIYHPAGLSLISRGVERRGVALGYHGVAGNVGTALGPLATLLLLLVVDWRTTAALLALPAAVGVALVFVLDVPDPGVASAPDGGEGLDLRTYAADAASLFRGGFALVFAIVVLEGLFYRGTLTFLPDLFTGFAAVSPVSVAGRSIDPARFLYAGLLLVGVAGQFVGGRLTDHVREERLLVGVFALLALVALAFVPAASAGFGPLVLASAALGVVLFGEQPVLQSTVAEHSTADVRGVSYGFMYVGVFGVGALGAALAGVVLTYASPREMFLGLAGVATLAGVLALTLAHRSRA
ncbi:MAG: MFS transporter [Halobacteriaceae archaeon]